MAIALKVEAGRMLLAAPGADLRRRGETMLAELVTQDASGLAASALEGVLPTAAARVDLIGNELAAAETDAPAEAVRALRFRLAHHYEEDGRFAEAMAALTPLRSEGDPLARAWSYELARRSGEAILEVAILSEETRASDGALGDEAFVRFAHGEALARAGDPSGAAAAFRRALAVASTGPAAVDAALALLRIAASDRAAGPDALGEALRALAAACAEGESAAGQCRRWVARGARRVRVRGAGEPGRGPGRGERRRDAAARGRSAARARGPGGASVAVGGEARRMGRGGRGAARDGAARGTRFGRPSPTPNRPGRRTCSRARSPARGWAGAPPPKPSARRAWETSHQPALAAALSDLPVVAGAWPQDRPDPRRARARRNGASFGAALDLEVALDAERRGALGSALAIYGSVIAADPERLEAWSGIRRVARAGAT